MGLSGADRFGAYPGIYRPGKGAGSSQRSNILQSVRRGLPGQERIVDWITLDVEGSYFPDAERDNFGQEVGLLGYDFRWHLGDRFTVLSDGQCDFFADGLRTVSLSALVTRPAILRYLWGIRSIEGPISSKAAITAP